MCWKNIFHSIVNRHLLVKFRSLVVQREMDNDGGRKREMSVARVISTSTAALDRALGPSGEQHRPSIVARSAFSIELVFTTYWN